MNPTTVVEGAPLTNLQWAVSSWKQKSPHTLQFEQTELDELTDYNEEFEEETEKGTEYKKNPKTYL